MEKETFGQRLSKYRKENNFTQSEIADRLGVTAQAVSKWENDLASPDIDALIKLAEIYDVTVDELLGKESQKVELKEKPSKKDIDKMFLRVRIDDKGDKVNVNLPLALVKAFVDAETGKLSFVTDNKSVDSIDFRKVIELVERGVVGEIVSIEEKDGGRVSVFVE